MTDFGKGPTLAEANPWLRDEAERIERILDVTERDSVIEGLPPFSEETRAAAPQRTHGRFWARASAWRMISTIGA